jgi:hypothetical protein
MSEIIACPGCRRQLNVPESYFGRMVQCPDCQHEFKAEPAGGAIQESKTPSAPSAAPTAVRKRREDDDEFDPPTRPRRYEDDDDDLDYADLGVRHHFVPHRGGMILAFGLIALIGGWMCCVPAVLGPVAWIMGTADLREIRAGRMDPSGESATRSGQVCGVIATIFMILGILLVIFLWAIRLR